MQRMILVLTLGCVMGVASARDAGQWETTDPTVRGWYQALMQRTIQTLHVVARPMRIGRTRFTSITAGPTPS